MPSRSRDIALRRDLPEWSRRSLTLPLPFGKGKTADGEHDLFNYLVLDLPMSDLFSGANEYLSGVIPALRPIIENQVGKKFFSGAPIEGKMVPLAGWANLPILTHMLEASGIAKRNTQGDLLVSDKTQNLLTGIPIYSRFRNWVMADPDRTKLRLNTFTSTLFGIGIRPQDEADLTKAEMAFYFDEVQPVLDALKELGVQLPDKDQIDSSVFTYLGLEQPQQDLVPTAS